MLTFLVFVAVLVLLVAAVGSPYGQTWFKRWHG
ncbi:Hydrophobic protein [Mycobacterium sp. smrl_JER01]